MLSKRKKQTIVKEAQIHEKDSGSAEVQISLLTEQVESLVGHLKKHPKDHHSRRGLLMMIGKRRRLLTYLKNRKLKKYEALIKKLNLKSI